MVIRTFLDKCTTIFKDSSENFGLNPIVSLTCGKTTSHILLHFDLNNDILENDFTHTLILKNSGETDKKHFYDIVDPHFKRISSFDVIALPINKKWDVGNGFDKGSDFWLTGEGHVSIDGSNWFQSSNGYEWDEEGVYSDITLLKEIEKYNSGIESLILDVQHFDRGNEDLIINLNKYIDYVKQHNNENYGILLCFAPTFKNFEKDSENINYISFFSNNTRTFYEPYVESRIDEPILDNRHRFKLGKINRLYFYSKLDNEFIDLDELPTCTIDDIVYPVTRHRKGCYYATVNALNNFRHDELYYDIWGGLKYQGDDIDDVEMSFTTNKGHALTLGESYTSSKKIDATIIGINDYEKILQGEKRELNVIFRVPYQSSCYDLYEKAFYRLYIKDGKDEVNVIDWDSIDILDNFNSFVIDFATLLPHEYHIDIKLYNGKNTQIFKDITKFIVVDTNNNKI